MYYDEDGDLAHEFYEETIVTKNGRKRAKLKRIHKNLIPQVACGERWGQGSAKVPPGQLKAQLLQELLHTGPFPSRHLLAGKPKAFCSVPSFCFRALASVCPGSHPCHLLRLSGEEKLMAPFSSTLQREAVPQPF